MPPYDCEAGQEIILHVEFDLTQLVQISNVLSFVCDNLSEYNERTNLNCKDCDVILRDLSLKMNLTTAMTRDRFKI